MSDEIRYLGDVQRLALAPDDIIVLTTDAAISSEAAERLKQHMERALPGRKVLVMSGGIKLGVLAPEAAAS